MTADAYISLGLRPVPSFTTWFNSHERMIMTMYKEYCLEMKHNVLLSTFSLDMYCSYNFGLTVSYLN